MGSREKNARKKQKTEKTIVSTIQQWAEVKVEIITAAGHSPKECGNASVLVWARTSECAAAMLIRAFTRPQLNTQYPDHQPHIINSTSFSKKIWKKVHGNKNINYIDSSQLLRPLKSQFYYTWNEKWWLWSAGHK